MEGQDSAVNHHGELMSTDFQHAVYDAVACFVQSKNTNASSTRCRTRSRCQLSDDDRDEHDGPLFLVVTIKPRLDRLLRPRPNSSRCPEHPDGGRLCVHAFPAASG